MGTGFTRSLERAVSGRVVLITGASSGIGRAAANMVGASGGIVLLVARRREQLEATKHEIELRGGEAHVHPCDLSDPVDIDRMAAEVLACHGRVDVLVNNAGRSIRRSVCNSYERFHDFQRTVQLNYFGAVRLILDLLPAMRERRGGHIINVSSAGVQTGAPMFSAYLASKAALDSFSRAMGFEVAGDGVHVSTVYMPLVRTPMIAPTRMFDRWPALTPEQAAGLICDAIRKRPARISTRLGAVGEIAHAAAPRFDGAVNALISRLRLGPRWREIVADGAIAGAHPTGDLVVWRDAFRRRLERALLPTDPDEVRRLALLLARIPLFEACTFDEMHWLASTAYPIAFEEDERLCVEGADSADCYVVVEGEALVTLRGTPIGVVRADQVVGERGPIEGRPRSATVTATTRVLAYAISCDRLQQLARTNPTAAEHMRRVVASQYVHQAVAG